jgi:NhaP-type Na+/H+ or K+/H+ antiporter
LGARLDWVRLEPSGYPLFGALISPTSPMTVIGILKEAKVPHTVEFEIAGEWLYNGGIGIVAFIETREKKRFRFRISVAGDLASRTFSS